MSIFKLPLWQVINDITISVKIKGITSVLLEFVILYENLLNIRDNCGQSSQKVKFVTDKSIYSKIGGESLQIAQNYPLSDLTGTRGHTI